MTSQVLQVVHRTDYAYDEVVNESHGRAHLLPREEPGQRVRSRSVVVTPSADEVHDHRDYFGNRSTYFRLASPHTELAVVSTSVVEVERDPVPWDVLDAPVPEPLTDPLDRELLLASPMVPRLTQLRDYAAPLVDRPLGTGLRQLLDRLSHDFAYEAGSTTVSTPVEQFLHTRKGVCQDFAHLLIGCLRLAGVPARYVSGYLQTLPPPGKPRLAGSDASHAWVSALVPGHGWIDLDPTNNQQADHRYVVVARGRDYSDVPPLKGVIFTRSTTSTMKVAVDVVPVEV